MWRVLPWNQRHYLPTGTVSTAWQDWIKLWVGWWGMPGDWL
jgi:hypothetical protein